MNEPAWLTEPDEKRWEHAGMQCGIRRPYLGHLCGYVGVDKAHPWHGKHYSDRVHCKNVADMTVDPEKVGFINLFCASIKCDPKQEEASIDLILQAHGGITFSGSLEFANEADSGLWWFGFDCNHYGDLSPSSGRSGGLYRDMAYVTAETERLAEQLAAFATLEGGA